MHKRLFNFRRHIFSAQTRQFVKFSKQSAPHIFQPRGIFLAFTAGTLAYFVSNQVQQQSSNVQSPVLQVLAQEQAAAPTDDDLRFEPANNPLFGVVPDIADLDITLYQYQVCPFCCKVRAFLDYNKIPYKIVEVDPVFKREVSFSKTYKKVPIAVINGVQVNDSTSIISTLNQFMLQKVGNKLEPSVHENIKKWRQWVDHKFVHTIPPNIYRNRDEAIAAFEYISDMNNFSYVQRQVSKYLGSSVMYVVSKNLKKKYKIEDEREAIYECGDEWVRELGSKLYHGGDKPDLADLAVYGVLTSIEGLLTFSDLLDNTDVGDWFMRMKETVGSCSGKRIN